MIQKDNKNYWETQAEKFSGHQVSWWDVNMKAIEVNTIARFLSGNDYILDVGCSNGASTIELQRLTGARFHGIDYSERAIRQAGAIERPGLTFEYMNLLDFSQKDTFDKAISIRMLINLMDPRDQRRGLEIIRDALKPGGVYVMCEAFSGALDNLNRARETFGLKPLAMPAYNRYLDEEKMETLVDGLFSVEEVVKHSSLYYVGTRIFQYLAMDGDPTEFDTDLHRFFGKYGFETKNSGDFGPNKIYVLKRL